MLDMKPIPKMNRQAVAGAYGMRLPDTYHIKYGVGELPPPPIPPLLPQHLPASLAAIS